MKLLRIAIATLSLLLLTLPVSAAGVRIKLATLAPDGSAWHLVLEEMGATWQERTDGRVRVVLYAGGVAGDEPDMLRKIRIGQLHGASLTTAGFSDVDSAFDVFTIPLFFESWDEFVYVRDKLAPELERRLESKGLKLLHWGRGGWIHLFSKQPVRTVADLRQVKMFTWAGDDGMSGVWKAKGFRPVPLAATDVLTGLQTGLIDALPTTPLAALSMQWFRHTPFMIEPGVAPLGAGTVIDKRVWDRLSEQDRRILLEAAREAERRLAVEIPAKDGEAVAEMQKRGLKVIDVEAEGSRAEWEQLARELADEMRARLVPPEIFDAAQRYRDEFRKGRAAGSAR